MGAVPQPTDDAKLVQIALDQGKRDQRLRRLLCGKASPFRTTDLMNNLRRAARRPTDCAEEKGGFGLGRKAAGFPQSGAAEPR
jgi:hypothetical protein